MSLNDHELRKALLDKLARRAEALLKESDDPQREMAWAEQRLSEANLLGWGHPDRKNLFAWTEEVLAENTDIYDRSIDYLRQRGMSPEEDAETFESLILQLIPAEGGL